MDKSKNHRSPLVSIIMPTYNHEVFVQDSIMSVLQQTYENLELIIINDDSNDETEKMIIQMQKVNQRIIYLKNKKNVGLIKTFNKGVKTASGKYLAPLNADDYWQDKEKLEKQVEFLEKNPEYILVGNFVENVNSARVHHDFQNYTLDDYGIRLSILRTNQFSFPSVLTKTASVQKLGGFEDGFPYAGDLLLWLKLGLHGKFKNLPFYGTGRRLTGINIGETKRTEQIQEVIKIISRFKHEYPHYKRATMKLYTELIAFSLPKPFVTIIRKIKYLLNL